MLKVDLHMHSVYSDDGEYTPTQLMEFCSQQKVDVAAIADHNSIDGVVEASAVANKLGIKLIPAIEIDCTYAGINLHVLGYGIDINDPSFTKIRDNYINQEQQASSIRLAAVRNLGIVVNEEEINKLTSNQVITGEMIAEVALADVLNHDNQLLLPYRQGNNRSDNPYVNFYWDFCSQGKAGYVEIEFPTLKETIYNIQQANGVAVLAHPGLQIKDDLILLAELIDQGLQGIEVYSNYHNSELSEKYYEFAQKRKLLITCGSDFHGKTKPSIQVGSTSSANCTMDKLIQVISHHN